MASNPIDGLRIDRDAISYIGHDLQRPDYILAERDGSCGALFVVPLSAL